MSQSNISRPDPSPVVAFAAVKMTDEDYSQQRDTIRATYGDTATERTGRFDQELACLFTQSGWTQEKLATVEGKTQQWVAYRLRFGRFLEFTTAVVIPKNLTEGRFRSYWARTDADEMNERIRFREVARLMEEEITRSRPIRHTPAIAEAIKATCGDEGWHRFTTITRKVQEVVKEATADEIEGVLHGMVVRGTHNVFAEKKREQDIYRIVIGGKQKIDLVALKKELGPLIDGLKAEGRKNMATMSPVTVAHLTCRLERAIDKLAHLAPDEGATD